MKIETYILTPSFAFCFSSGDALEEKMKKVAKSAKINAIDSLAILNRNEK